MNRNIIVYSNILYCILGILISNDIFPNVSSNTDSSFIKDELSFQVPESNVSAYGKWKYVWTLSKSEIFHGMSGKGNVNQSLAIDPTLHYIYSQHVSGNKSYVVRYPLLHKVGSIAATAKSNATNKIGHQGLSIQNINQIESRIWSSAGAGIENYGRYAIRFSFIENSDIANIEEFKLFDDNFSPTGSSMPTVTSDNQFLIARGYLNSQSVIRIFRVNDLVKSGDYSSKYIQQFSIDDITKNKEYPLQGMASDCRFIYIFLGYYNTNYDKLLMIYDFQGNLMSKESLIVGKEQALQTGKGEHWEVEGAAISNNNLYLTIVSGDAGKRENRIYYHPINR